LALSPGFRINNNLILEYKPLVMNRLCFFQEIRTCLIGGVESFLRASALILFFLIAGSLSGNAQRFLSDFDSSYFVKDTIRPILKRFENLRFTGYIQPQLQLASSEGASSYAGGNFSTYSKSRFMLRRARVKIDYLMTQNDRLPQALFSFQIDATERGVFVRDMFLKLFETKKDQLSITMGLFARPFGYEVNLSSAFRETPERGRMSQIIFPTERDLGAMISYEPQKIKSFLHHIKFDVGLFNGQGLSGPTDFDSYKDLISRLLLKPISIKKWQISGGLSLLRGGWINNSTKFYQLRGASNGAFVFYSDSNINNVGRIAPRHYFGGDLQLKLTHGWGETEWRAEYWSGKQPGTAFTSANIGVLPTENSLPLPAYVRPFNGAFLLFLQNIINHKHQLMVKYDWYDPNRFVKGSQINLSSGFSAADIKYSTLGLGYSYQLNETTKLIFYQDWVKNEITSIDEYSTNLPDNVFTVRFHFRF
jgi:hypothetical protein